MKNKLMISGSAIALVATFGAHQALAGNGNEAFVTQDGSFNNAEIDQAAANFAGVGLETRPFLQEGNGNDLSVIQQDPTVTRGPRVATITPSTAMQGEEVNGFQLGAANTLTVEQSRSLPGPSVNVNWVGTLWQDGNFNFGSITQEAVEGWSAANLRQTGDLNIATLLQQVQSSGSGRNRLGEGYFTGAGGGTMAASRGGAVQNGTLNIMQIEQLSLGGADINRIDLASQSGNANVMNINQAGSNSELSFGASLSAHQFASSLGLARYVSLQEGAFNFLNLDMTGSTGSASGGILFSTRQLGQGNTASVSLSGTLTEFALNQDGSLNSLDGIATGDNNDLAVNQVGVDVVVPPFFFIPEFTISGGGNDASFFVDGNSNEMLIDQQGNLNDALVEIVGDSNKSPVRQTGNLNDAFVDILGNSNSAPVTQTGSRNDADLVIDGNLNTASATQIGADNLIELSIIGNDNTSTLSSEGDLNTILGTVEGNDNTSTVMQNGNGNTAVFAQIGNFNTVSIMQ